jgi:GNAT superfamily N-acetyltransferase
MTNQQGVRGRHQSNPSITYRPATPADAESIADLHALSWRQSYRGILSDAYLDGDVERDRREVWLSRLAYPAPNQYLLVAEAEGQLRGFVCAFGDDNPRWGTLVDNLHVRQDLKGQGVGTALLERVGEWVKAGRQHAGFYLWVFEENHAARRFYENRGGETVERAVKDNPGGGRAVSLRVAWPTGQLRQQSPR